MLVIPYKLSSILIIKMDVNKLTNTQEVVKLLSNDGEVFYVNKDVVMVSKFIQTALEQNRFLEGKASEIKLHDITSEVLEVCIEYMHYKIVYQNLPPESRKQFMIAPNMALDVLNAAMFLEC
jgi:hypothetical protein